MNEFDDKLVAIELFEKEKLKHIKEKCLLMLTTVLLESNMSFEINSCTDTQSMIGTKVLLYNRFFKTYVDLREKDNPLEFKKTSDGICFSMRDDVCPPSQAIVHVRTVPLRKHDKNNPLVHETLFGYLVGNMMRKEGFNTILYTYDFVDGVPLPKIGVVGR